MADMHAGTLDDVLSLNGVAAAGEFTLDGQMVTYQADMDLSLETAAMTAQFCATTTMLFNTLAGAHTALSGMQWLPQRGWTYTGGEWTLVVGGLRWVLVETAKADFDKLFGVLIGAH